MFRGPDYYGADMILSRYQLPSAKRMPATVVAALVAVWHRISAIEYGNQQGYAGAQA
jgi:hypothetical protein